MTSQNGSIDGKDLAPVSDGSGRPDPEVPERGGDSEAGPLRGDGSGQQGRRASEARREVARARGTAEARSAACARRTAGPVLNAIHRAKAS